MFELLFLLLTTVSSLTIVTEDAFPHDGTKRFLWGASKVYKTPVQVFEKGSSVSDRVASLFDLVLFCDSHFLALGGTDEDITNGWKLSGFDVVVHIDSDGQLKCAIGQADKLSKFLAASTPTEPLPEVPDVTVTEDEAGNVFLVMDRYPGMVGNTDDKMKFYNFETRSSPPVLLGSLSTYSDFLRLTNYVPNVFDWNKVGSRRNSNAAEYNPLSYYHTQEKPGKWLDEVPTRYGVMVTALFVKEDTALLGVVLERFRSLSWKTDKRIFLVFNRFPLRDPLIQDCIREVESRTNHILIRHYNASTMEVKTNQAMYEETVRVCQNYSCDWVWFQDSSVVNVQYQVLNDLVVSNFSVSTFLTLSSHDDEDPTAAFWGATTSNGFYSRSHDYFDIVNRNLGGIFAVPYVSGSYMVRASILTELSFRDAQYNDGDTDIVFCNSVRRSGHMMMLDATKSAMIMVNGRNNESDPYPFFEHAPNNKAVLFLSYYMKWNHIQERIKRSVDIGPLQQPCEDVFLPAIFSEITTALLNNSLHHRGEWTHRRWNEGWDHPETMPLEEAGISEAWLWFSKDYIPSMVDKKFSGFKTWGTPLQSFGMRLKSGTEPTDSLEGKGVVTVLLPLEIGPGTQIVFNDICFFTPKLGDVVIFPSRFTHRVRFVPPKEGQFVTIASFYNDK